MLWCVCARGLRRQTWADGPQRCSHTVSGHCDWCIATSKKVEHLAADPQSELIRPASSLFSRGQRADGWFGQNTHTFSTFPPWRKACALLTSPSPLQGGHDGGAGRTCAQSHGEEPRRHTDLLLHLDGENLTPSLFWGAFVAEATPYASANVEHMSPAFVWYVRKNHSINTKHKETKKSYSPLHLWEKYFLKFFLNVRII